MKPLAQIDLDRISTHCDAPECVKCAKNEPLFFAPRCHPAAGVVVVYKKGTGVLAVACKACGRPVAVVAVATFPPES